ncbi:MAG TPA: MBL fold metallo-hydrolase [Stellaceae bacterium]|nr:MBL fold metallo-hydrolase [Stellaceae bacterium]
MEIRFLGSGDAFGSGGRYHTCFLVTAAETRFLIDCGASSLIALKRFGVEPNSIDSVLVSHLHGDHFGGLPFFLLDAHLVSRRTRPLTLAGPPGFRDRLHQAQEVLFPGSTGITPKFPLTLIEMPERVAHRVGPVRVTPFLVQHYSGAPPYALRIEVDGRVVTYSGDTEWVENLVPAAAGADLFIVEAYFYDKKVKYHLDYATLRGRLAEIGAKRVILTHMSAELLARRAEVNLDCAEDGLAISL